MRTAAQGPLASHRLEGQVVAVGLLSKLAASNGDADAPELFIDALFTTVALAVDGKTDAVAERLKGMARILGPAIRDGVIARKDGTGR